MINFFILLKAQLKRILKDTNTLVYFIGFPILIFMIIFIMRFFINRFVGDSGLDNQGLYNVAMDEAGYFVKDTGDKWKLFFSGTNSWGNFSGEKSNESKEYEKAYSALLKGKIAGLVIIPHNFSSQLEKGEKPQLEIFTITESSILENRIQALNVNINAYLLHSFISKASLMKQSDITLNKINAQFKANDKKSGIISLGLKMITIVILYIITFGSTGIVTDLIKFRETKMLNRAIISPNSDIVILASFLLSFVIIQTAINMIVFFAAAILFNVKLSNLILIFIAVFSESAFALSLSILIARILKKSSQLTIASTITSLITIVLFFLALVSVFPFERIPNNVKLISVFSPLYWLMEMLDKEKIFPNIIAVWAIIIAIFTSGSWRIKEFNS